MNDDNQTTDDPASNQASSPPLAAATIERRHQWLPSLVWLIPIIAALIGIVLVAKLLLDRGPVITIAFKTAEGLEAGRTKVKYKDVDIGEVKEISLSKDHSQVYVKVQLVKDADGFTTEDTQYWVVKTRISAAGVSGLNTLFSGTYIGADAGKKEETKTEFVGLESQPIVTHDASGKQFVLRAADLGSLDIGSPVFYRRIKVGQVAAFQLDENGKGVTLRIFVNAPYDKLIGLNTRFWQASGINVNVNAGGFTLNTESLASIILGGLAFQSIDDNPGEIAKENTSFLLADDQKQAFKAPDGEAYRMVVYFNNSVRGLLPGAAVDFRGVVIGEVKSVGIEYDQQSRSFKMPVVIDVYPARIGREYGEDMRKSPRNGEARLQNMVKNGFRAQLRTGNLLTGQLYVALDFFPKAAKNNIDFTKTPVELPTVPNDFDEIQNQLAAISSKLSKVPFDEIGQDLQKTLVTLNRSLNSADVLVKNLNNDIAPEITAAIKDVRKTLDTADKTLNSANSTLSIDAPLQQDLRQTLQDLSRAAASLTVLTDYLQQHPESLIRGKKPDNAQ